MIPQAHIIQWRNVAPWSSPDQVEHDLVLSRAISELYAHPLIGQSLGFRGGTALHKLYFDQAGRFSEDLDFVQIKAEPIGDMVKAIRSCLDHWLGRPTWKQSQGRFTLSYYFITELEPVVRRKVKIEINTREHFAIHPPIKKVFQVSNDWFQGKSEILTYSLEELLATKLRALYQRKKGRDLYDFWYAVEQPMETFDVDEVIRIFQCYMQNQGVKVSRAEFEKNLFLKQNSPVFNNDIKPLLSSHVKQYQPEEAYKMLFQEFLIKLAGKPWKGLASQ